jgi:hypothetical protein
VNSKAALFLLLVTLAACTGGTSTPAAGTPNAGRRIASGEARVFTASPDGAWVAWLDGCHVARGQYLPPGTANCDARVAPAAGGEARRVAGAVTTLPHGLGWSPSGASLAILADYDYAAGGGTLVLWRDGSATELARDVTFHGFGAHGELGFVSGGRMSVLLPGDASPRAVAGADAIATFELSPAEFPTCDDKDGLLVRLAARRTRAAGGQLLTAGCRLDAVRPLEQRRVAEYGFSGEGSHLAYTLEGKGGSELRLVQVGWSLAGWTVGKGVQSFAFAPDGRTLAWIGDVTPATQGNLYAVEPGGAPKLLAREVGDYRWARNAPRLAWIERYDPRVRSGTLGAGGPGLAPRSLGRNVTDVEISADGLAVAFLQHTTRGGYSVDLGLASLVAPAGAAPPGVAQGVFGFSVSPDGKWLYYRTRCVRNGEGCDLKRIPAAGVPKDGKPALIAPGMKSFEFDPRDPSRLLIGWQRSDRQALDIGLFGAGGLVRLDQSVLPGSARFLGPDSRRVGYVVIDPKRAGVYVAEAP